MSEAKRRPPFPVIAGAAVALGLAREGLERLPWQWGLLVLVLVFGGLTTWRLITRRMARKRGVELTPEGVRAKIAQSGFSPAFEEDGTVLGASVLVVSQVPKVVEVQTEHEVYGSDGERLATVRQVHQSRWKRFFRLVTSFDQYFTHRFDVLDADGQRVLHVLRPRKLFYTRVHVFDGQGEQLGTIRQENVFFKIRFSMQTPEGEPLGRLHAQNWRAWDFTIQDRHGRDVAQVFKAWEGWLRAAATRADSYVIRIGEPLHEPFRSMVVATALTIDLALKQDARG